MGTLRYIEKKAAMVFAIIACLVFLHGGYKYHNAEDYYTVPGEWERSDSEIRENTWNTILPPNQPTTVNLRINWQHRVGHAFTWEAENPKAFTIAAEWNQNGGRSSSAWQRIQLDRVYTLHRIRGFVRYTVTNTSNQPQAFRFGLQYRHYDSQEPYWANYQTNLCNQNGCEAPLTPAALMVGEADIKAEAQSRIWLSAGVLILAVIFWIGSFNILAAVFPSGVAQRVRAGFGTGGGYFGPAANPLRREQDLDDLPNLIAKTKLEIDDLKTEEGKFKKVQSEQETVSNELEAAITKVKNLKARQAALDPKDSE